MIGVVLSPLRMFKDVYDSLHTYSAGNWAELTVSGGARYNPILAPYLLGELAANILQIAFALLLVRMFFSRRSSFPRAFIAFLATAAAIQALDLGIAVAAFSRSDHSTALATATLIRDIVSGALWSWYFLVSKRVAATFVERLHPRANATPETGVRPPPARADELLDMGDAAPSTL